MRTTRLFTLFLVTSLFASVAGATSFLVPSDDWLIEHADLIVSGTVVDRHARVGSRGWIETVFTVRVDEQLKGSPPENGEVTVTELGGTVGDRVLRVAGSATYDVGDRYLLFLRRVGDRLVTYDLFLGKFTFRAGPGGESLLVRDEHVSDGSTNPDSSVRTAADFLGKIREVVRHGPDEESLRSEMNLTQEQEPGDVRLAALVASGSWSADESSTIDYSVSSVFASGDEAGDDGEDRVIAGDPHDLIPGTLGIDSSIIAVAMYGCRAEGCVTIDDPSRGSRFAGIAWADILLNDVSPDIALNQSLLNTVLTHEMGHTLGFRHSDRVKNDSNPSASQFSCSEPLPCSTDAVMTAEANETLNGVLAGWDRDAANAVYGDGSRSSHAAADFVDDLYIAPPGEWVPSKRFSTEVAWRLPAPSCSPIAIVEQPRSETLAEGEELTLTVEASGDQLEFRWYEGEQGDTSRPVGSGPTLHVDSLRETTSFWVLVTGPCASVESESARITVRAACSPNELCTLSNRFHISLRATDQRTRMTGRGVPKPENDLFGSFSLPELTGNPENPEVFVKLLDGREVNGQFWVFYGGLTDLDYVLMVSDVDTGEFRTYHKPAGSTAGGFDVGNGVSPESCSAEVDGQRLTARVVTDCGSDGDDLCLGGGRFRIDLSASDPRTGATGVGEAISQNDLSGYFSLPALTGNPNNPEVFVKVLDGREVNGHFWFFFSGLTDLEYSIVVTDNESGARKAYVKAAGSACGAFDTDAF